MSSSFNAPDKLTPSSPSRVIDEISSPDPIPVVLPRVIVAFVPSPVPASSFTDSAPVPTILPSIVIPLPPDWTSNSPADSKIPPFSKEMASS